MEIPVLDLGAAARPDSPFYVPVGREGEIFEAAWSSKLAVMLKGPTGCGKTRLVEYMAWRLSIPLFSVACHEDLTAGDLVGRYLLYGSATVWVDGPLTRAAKDGGICYLDEVVEARQDTTVLIHPLADHRRELLGSNMGQSFEAAAGFCLVISFNPGYQSLLKDLKASTRQRFICLELGFPPVDVEEEILIKEAGIESALATDLVRLGNAIRGLDGSGLRETASTRLLVAAAQLTRHGVGVQDACIAAIVGPLTDDLEAHEGLTTMVEAYIKG